MHPMVIGLPTASPSANNLLPRGAHAPAQLRYQLLVPTQPITLRISIRIHDRHPTSYILAVNGRHRQHARRCFPIPRWRLPVPLGEDPSFTQLAETAAARHLTAGRHTGYATPNALATALISLQHAQSLPQNPLRDMSPAPSVAGQDNGTPEAARVSQPVHAATCSPSAALIAPHAITPTHNQGVTLADPNVVSQHPALNTPDVGSIAASTGTSGPHSLRPMMPSTTSHYAGSRLALYVAKDRRICRPPEVPLLKQVLVQEALRAHEVRIASRPRASAKASTTASPARGVRGPRKSNKLSGRRAEEVGAATAKQPQTRLA